MIAIGHGRLRAPRPAGCASVGCLLASRANARSLRAQWLGRIGILAVALFAVIVARAGAISPATHVGDTYEITLTKDSVQHGSKESSGSSHDQDRLVERVIGVRAEGLELQYDLPSSATPDDRARSWQFPVRVFKPLIGPAQLLNGAELETRVNVWLKAAGLPRTACGQWYFTWSAFRIECDPQSVLKTIQAFDLRSADFREGAVYTEPDARGSGTLARRAGRQGSAIFTVEMPVEPDVYRRARAESDVVVGEIMKKPLSIDAALNKRALEIISGTISVEFETDAAGDVRRRTKLTNLVIAVPDGSSETETVTETLARQLISRPN